MLTSIYILNATLLLLHEIESSYEKEWEILKLPGRITGFLIMHMPIILLFFYGVIEIEKGSMTGLIIGVITGISGLLPSMRSLRTAAARTYVRKLRSTWRRIWRWFGISSRSVRRRWKSSRARRQVRLRPRFSTACLLGPLAQYNPSPDSFG